MILSEELQGRVARLLELIASMNEAIAQHNSGSKADVFQAGEFLRLKSRLEKELLDLLATEFDIQIPVAAAKAA